MKKKTIALCLITMILGFCLISILIAKKNSKYIMQDGVMLAMTLDGQKISTFPEQGDYSVSIDCTNAKGKWLPDEWKFVVEEITGNVICNLDFVSNPKSLKTEVEDNATQYNAVVPDYTNTTTLAESEYVSPSQFSSTTYSSTSGTTVTDAFTYSGTEWSSVPANLTKGTFYHLKMNVPSDEYYELCYTMSSGHSYNTLHVYINTTRLNYFSASTSSSKEGCIEIGKVTTNDYIKVVQRAYSSTSYPIATVSFYLKKTTDTNTYDTGYRYSGKTPDNWVWFNGEKWRIIGSIPTCTSSGCETSENLVKIIRNNSLGAYAYEADELRNGEWGSSTLYSILNTHYYASDATAMNGQDHAGCYGYYSNSIGSYPMINCDYSNIGILSSGYYGQMVKNVYWNTGASEYNVIPGAAYVNEIANQTVSGYVGLMTASDWGYAADSSYHNTSMYYYSNISKGNNAANTIWLFNNGNEWTSIQNSDDSTYALHVASGGLMYSYVVIYGYAVRPVVYLDSEVYIISGSGSEKDPYIIGI